VEKIWTDVPGGLTAVPAVVELLEFLNEGDHVVPRDLS